MKSTYLLLLVLLGSILYSCKKNAENFTEKPVNQLSYQSFDTSGYRLNVGDTLRIDPGVQGTLDKNLNPDNYEYEWKLLLSNTEDRIISTSGKLKVVVNYSPGSYRLSLYTKDKSTGLTFISKSTLYITTTVYEGFFVLNNVSDTARLDFLSYNTITDKYTQYTNVQKTLNVPMAPKGFPYQVGFQYSAAGGSYVFLLTSSGTSLLNAESFAYNPAFTLKSLVKGELPAGFKAQKMVVKRNALALTIAYQFSAEDVIHSASPTDISYLAAPVNFYSATKTKFTPAPFRVSDEIGSTTVMYDQTNKQFVSMNNNSYYVAPVDPLFNFPKGKDLVYMTDNGKNILRAPVGLIAYAILKDPGISKYYMLRFIYAGNPLSSPPKPNWDYFQEITATDFALAENYAISPELGYLFYSVGGKLYEYDLFLKSSKLMLDKGAEKISYISFDLNANGNANMINALIVGSYNPSGKEGENGTLSFYTVPTINGDLILTNKWTGMGKVVNAAYRFRK